MNKLYIDIGARGIKEAASVGIYRACESKSFRVLTLGYAIDDNPVTVIDLLHGGALPGELLKALRDPEIKKISFDARIARICLSHLLRFPEGEFLPAAQWCCLKTWVSSLGKPCDGEHVSEALGENEELFAIANAFYSEDDDKGLGCLGRSSAMWQFCLNFMEVTVRMERTLYSWLENCPMPDIEWAVYHMNERINDRGVRVDEKLIQNAVLCDREERGKVLARFCELTGLSDISSDSFRTWLEIRGVNADSLSREAFRHACLTADHEACEAMSLWQIINMTSTRKYHAINRAYCNDGRLRGLFTYGGGKNGKFGNAIVQTDNLPTSQLSELSFLRGMVKSGYYAKLTSFCEYVPEILSDLLSTVFVPGDGAHMVLAEYGMPERCIMEWLAKDCGIERLEQDFEAAAMECLLRNARTQAHGIVIEFSDNNLHIQLPSGRALIYCDAALDFDNHGKMGITYDGRGYKGRWQTMNGNGHTLASDIVQGIARDLLTDTMLRMEQSGLPVVMHRPGTVVLESKDPNALVRAADILHRVPAWANGLCAHLHTRVYDHYLEKTAD